MTCNNCGHDKKAHASVHYEGYGKMGNKHEGKCSFHTMFDGKAGNFCDCEVFVK